MTGAANGSLKDKTVLVVGRGSGLARAIALAALDAGAGVVAVGRDAEALSAAYADISARNPARRIGTPEDIAQGVMFALTNTFLTGQTLHVDGGEPLT
jgi:NAD(P)-dependent dehydrogenase (short-subunit alcohol dehydrogenase family)